MAISLNLSLRVHGPDPDAVHFAAATDPVVIGKPAGQVFGEIVFSPPGWAGDVSLVGPDAGPIGINATSDATGFHFWVVTAAVLTKSGKYDVTVEAAG